MSEVVSGGKVWRIPEPDKTVIASPKLSMSYPKTAEKPKSKIKFGLFMLFAIVFPGGGIGTLAYFLTRPLKAQEPKLERENFAGGFNVELTGYSNIDAHIVFLSLLALFAVALYCFTHLDQLIELGTTWGLALCLAFMSIYMMPALVELADGTANASLHAFEHWAKEKYALADIEKLDDKSTTLTAKTQTGETTNFHILRKDDIVYLYETDEQLVEITQRIAKG